MRLLIIDDSSLARTRIKSFFSETANIEFAEAANGIEALEKHRIFSPNVIILDYIIPAPDGLAILKIISQIDNNAKVIMITTLGNQKYIYEDCVKCGASAILTKPLTKAVMMEAIQKAIPEIRICDSKGDIG